VLALVPVRDRCIASTGHSAGEGCGCHRTFSAEEGRAETTQQAKPSSTLAKWCAGIGLIFRTFQTGAALSSRPFYTEDATVIESAAYAGVLVVVHMSTIQPGRVDSQ
jgi:hypothetical protein